MTLNKTFSKTWIMFLNQFFVLLYVCWNFAKFRIFFWNVTAQKSVFFHLQFPINFLFLCMFFYDFVVFLYSIKFLESSPDMLSVTNLSHKVVPKSSDSLLDRVFFNTVIDIWDIAKFLSDRFGWKYSVIHWNFMSIL